MKTKYPITKPITKTAGNKQAKAAFPLETLWTFDVPIIIKIKEYIIEKNPTIGTTLKIRNGIIL